MDVAADMRPPASDTIPPQTSVYNVSGGYISSGRGMQALS